jgi:hypothetical protein
MGPFLGELSCPFAVDKFGGRVRKGAFGIVLGGFSLLRRLVTETSSAGVAESRSGPRKRAVRWKPPSLLRTMPGATSAAQGRKSAK